MQFKHTVGWFLDLINKPSKFVQNQPQVIFFKLSIFNAFYLGLNMEAKKDVYVQFTMRNIWNSRKHNEERWLREYDTRRKY